MSDYDIRSIPAADAVELRSAILDQQRTGRMRLAPGDEHPSARHVGAFHEERLVGVGSIHPQGMPGGHKSGAWRLNGLGVDFGHRGLGLGALLVERCLEHAAGLDAKVVWCLAPAGAYGFFERYGFRRAGDPIDSPEEGPQYLLYAEMRPLRRSWALES